MAYLRNATINLLNLHFGIHAIAMDAGSAFFGSSARTGSVNASAVSASGATRKFICYPRRSAGRPSRGG